MRKDAYKLTNDVGRTSKGKNQQYECQTATKCSQCPRGLIIQQPNQSKGSVQMPSHSQLRSKGLPNNVASLYAHSRARTH